MPRQMNREKTAAGTAVNYDNVQEAVFHNYLNETAKGKAHLIHFKAADKNKFHVFVDSQTKMLRKEHLVYKVNMPGFGLSEPYDPILPFIKNYIIENGVSIDELLAKSDVYPFHRPIFSDYFQLKPTSRAEDVFLDELRYEQTQFSLSIMKIIPVLFPGKTLVIAISDFHFAPSSTIDLVKGIVKTGYQARALFLIAYERDYRFQSENRNSAWQSFIGDLNEAQINIDLSAFIASGRRSWPRTGMNEATSADMVKRIGKDNLNFLSLTEANEPLLDYYLESRNADGQSVETGSILEILETIVSSFYYLGENDSALKYLQVIREKAEGPVHARHLSFALRMTGLCHLNTEDIDLSYRFAYQCIEFTSRIKDDLLNFKAYLLLYMIGDKITKPIDARYYRAFLSLVEKLGLENAMAFCYKNTYIYYSYYQSWEMINSLCDRAVRLNKKNKNEMELASCYHKKGIICTKTGDQKKAVYYLRKSASIRSRLGQPIETIRVNNGIGYFYFVSGDFKKSFLYYSRSLNLLNKISNFHEIAITLLNISFLFFYTGNHGRSIDMTDVLTEIMGTLKKSYIPFHNLADIYVLKALNYVFLRDFFNTLETINIIDNLTLELKPESLFYRNLIDGYMNLTKGDTREAGRNMKEAGKSLREMGDPMAFLAYIFYHEYAHFLFQTNKARAFGRTCGNAISLAEKKGHVYYARKFRKLVKNGFIGGSSMPFPPLQTDIGSLVELAKRESVTNKLRNSTHKIKFLNILHSQIDTFPGKEVLARYFLGLIHSYFPAEAGYLHIFENGELKKIAEFRSSRAARLVSDSVIMRLVFLKSEKLITKKGLGPIGLAGFSSVINIPFYLRGDLKANLFLAIANSEISFTFDDLDILSIAAGMVMWRFDNIDKEEDLIRTLRTQVDLNRRLSMQNQTLDQQIEMARNIQQQYLPRESPLPGISYLYKAMDKVGGDFFDFIVLKGPDRVGIFLSDVSGHGVPAAFITSMIKSTLMQVAAVINNPSFLLSYLNDAIYKHASGNFITAFYGIYNPSTREFIYSNAGHNPPLIIKTSPAEGAAYDTLPSEGTGLPLAVLQGNDLNNITRGYANSRVVLEKGCKLLLYTDGLTETVNTEDKARNSATRDFETSELSEFIREFSSLPAEYFIRKLFEKLVEFHGSDVFEDDVCVICVDIG